MTSHGDLAQSYDPVRDTTWRSWNPSSEATGIEELKPFLLRFTYPHKPDAWVGLGFQLRETVRDEVGVFMLHCRFVTWRNVGFHYLHGLGIVGQFSEDLTFQHIACEPRVETGRTCAGFADFMQMSGCRGLVSVLDSRFLGSHDDPINVHGTHLRIVERPAPDRIKVRFMHGQSYGFEAFTVGDQLEFIHARTLLSYGAGAVKSVERLDPYTIMLTLAQPMPDGFLDEDCVENVTWTPDVEIRGCRFGRDPTRGILVTTRGKVIIANNVFVRTTQCAILIADDARNWYESGPVHDVTIIGNQFIETGEPVIAISPEIVDRVPGQYVHHNIRIIDNIFRRSGGGMPIVASSTDGITCTGNIIVQPGGGSADNMIRLEGCAHALVAGNRNALARTQAPFPLDGSRNVGLTTGHAVLCVSSAENPRDDHDVEGAPLRIGSHAFMHGIGLHAPAELIFHLGASYHWFTTAVGINASVGAKGSAALEVWLDGKRFSQTPVLHGGDAPLFLCIPVTGVTEVRLVANDAGDGNAEDHLVLGEPRVLIDTRAPAPPAP